MFTSNEYRKAFFNFVKNYIETFVTEITIDSYRNVENECSEAGYPIDCIELELLIHFEILDGVTFIIKDELSPDSYINKSVVTNWKEAVTVAKQCRKYSYGTFIEVWRNGQLLRTFDIDNE